MQRVGGWLEITFELIVQGVVDSDAAGHGHLEDLTDARRIGYVQPPNLQHKSRQCRLVEAVPVSSS